MIPDLTDSIPSSARQCRLSSNLMSSQLQAWPSARAFFQEARDLLLYASSPQTILETSRCSTFAFKS
jgi:hypothetical protein